MISFSYPLRKGKTLIKRLINLVRWYSRDRRFDPPSELIEVLKDFDADKILHGSTTLLKHLVGTYRLLKQWNIPEEVCIAGLFHSVYGTQTFKEFLIDPLQREKLRAIIPHYSEELVYCFYIQDKKGLLKNLESEGEAVLRDRLTGKNIPLSSQKFEDLLKTRFADYIEQMSRMKFSVSFIEQKLIQSKTFINFQDYKAISSAL